MENINPGKKELFEWTPPTLEQAEESDYKKYLEVLELTEEDLKDKEILDVGAGAAIFAKYAKEKRISDSIFSLEPIDEMQTDKGVKAVIEAVPFKDQAFDMVISSGAYPYIASIDEDDAKKIEQRLRDGLNEMLRVIKSGGEIRLGPLGFDYAEDFKQVNELFTPILKELTEQGQIEIERVDQGEKIIKAVSEDTKDGSYMYIITKK
jgi:ubiquinone/menaquinone biosynthesis C-methylase UbiE